MTSPSENFMNTSQPKETKLNSLKSHNIKEKTCKHCSQIFKSKSGRQDFCSDQCKYDYRHSSASPRILTCLNCSKTFTPTGSTSKFCSPECRSEYAKHKKNSGKTCAHCGTDISAKTVSRKFCSKGCMIKFRLAKKNSGLESVDFITCPICERQVKQITPKHAKMHGFDSPMDMTEKLNMPAITCLAQKAQSKGENNPGYNHGGKYSKFSKQFVKGYDPEWHAKHIANIHENRKEHPEKFVNTIEYWLLQTDGDLVEATKLLKKFQLRDLNFFVTKYGQDEGVKRHALKIERWVKSFKKQNYSKISQTLFAELISTPSLDQSQIYFATFDRPEMVGYKNKEFRLKVDGTYILPDFIHLSKRKIIEFDGTYWHSNTVANPERELRRDQRILDAGYTVFHVLEHKYQTNKEEVIQECITFLTT